MTTLSSGDLRKRIETYFDDYELDVVCRKKKYGYSIYWADDREPWVRLKLTGRADEVELFYWDSGQWRPATDLGFAVPLEDALEYVVEDPEGLFFDNGFEAADSGPEDDRLARHVKTAVFAAALATLHPVLVRCSAFGAAVGGMFASCWWGMVCGGTAGVLCGCAWDFTYSRRLRWIALLLPGLPCGLAAAIGGSIGGAVNTGLGGELAGNVVGLCVGLAAAVLLFARGYTAWVVGFAAGLSVAHAAVTALDMREHFTGILVTALCAALTAQFCGRAAANYRRILEPNESTSRTRSSLAAHRR